LLACAVPLAMRTWRSWHMTQTLNGSALVNPALLRVPSLRQGLAASMALNGIVPAYLLTLTFVAQGALGVGPTRMAVLCLPIALAAALSISVLAQRLVLRMGASVIALGAGLQALALLLAFFSLQAQLFAAQPMGWPATLFIAHGLLGLGIGLTGPALTTASLQDVPLTEAGSASGVFSAVQQLAGALALAAVGGLLLSGLKQVAEAAAMRSGLSHVIPLLLGCLLAGACLSRPMRLPVDPH
jgi:hypothetical protein